MDELLKLLRENNALLKEIKALLEDDLKNFSINVAANLFVEFLHGNQEVLEQLKQHFKL